MAGLAARRVQRAELQATERGTLVCNDIIEPLAAEAVVIPEMETVRTGAVQVGHRIQIDQEVVLSTQRDRASGRRKSDKRLTSELEAALTECPVVQREAIFQREDGLVSTAEVFGALDAPAAALHVAGGLRESAVAAFVADVVEAFVDQSIQRHVALRICGPHAIQRTCEGSRRQQRRLDGTLHYLSHGTCSFKGKYG